MKLLSTLSILTGAAALAVPTLNAVTEVATVPVGVVEMTIPAGNSIVSPVFVNSSTFQGQSTSIAENGANSVIAFTGTPFEAGTFDEGSSPMYYVEVADGDAEGFSFNIISNTDSTLTIDALLLTDISLNQTETFVIRKHITLGQLFDSSTGLARRDVVKFFNSDGTTTLVQWTGTEWSDGSNPANDQPVYPGTGIVTSFNGDVDVMATGTVKNTKTVVPVYTVAGALNLVASGSPVDVAIDSLGLGSQLQRRDVIKFVVPGSLDTLALFTADGSGGLTPSSGTDLTSAPAGEAFLISSNSDLNIVFPAAYEE